MTEAAAAAFSPLQPAAVTANDEDAAAHPKRLRRTLLPPSSPLVVPASISLVRPHLCVGGERATAAELEALGVTQVIDCRNLQEQQARGPIAAQSQTIHTRVRLPLRDNSAEDAAKYFYSAIDLIDRARRMNSNEVVLVHCTRGISRSCALVCAYLIWSEQVEYRQSLALLRECRPEANPNVGFSLQLVDFACQREREVLAFSVCAAAAVAEGDGDDGLAVTELHSREEAAAAALSGVLVLINKRSRQQYVWRSGDGEGGDAAERALVMLRNLHPQLAIHDSCSLQDAQHAISLLPPLQQPSSSL